MRSRSALTFRMPTCPVFCKLLDGPSSFDAYVDLSPARVFGGGGDNSASPVYVCRITTKYADDAQRENLLRGGAVGASSSPGISQAPVPQRRGNSGEQDRSHNRDLPKV